MPKTTEPKIPDLPPGVPRDAEVQGDPGGGEGGGGGRRKMRDWSGSQTSRRMLERSMDGSRRGSRRMSEIEGSDMDGPRRGSRRNQERNGGAGVSNSGGFAAVDRLSVAWRRKRDSHWRMTGEWLGPFEPQEAPSSSGVLRVAEPVAKENPWRPWEDDRPDSDQGFRQTVSQLQSSVEGSHKANAGRSSPVADCPSSNLHHFVIPVPHTAHEVYPSLDVRAKKSSFEGKDWIERRFMFCFKQTFRFRR